MAKKTEAEEARDMKKLKDRKNQGKHYEEELEAFLMLDKAKIPEPGASPMGKN